MNDFAHRLSRLKKAGARDAVILEDHEWLREACAHLKAGSVRAPGVEPGCWLRVLHHQRVQVRRSRQ